MCLKLTHSLYRPPCHDILPLPSLPFSMENWFIRPHVISVCLAILRPDNSIYRRSTLLKSAAGGSSILHGQHRKLFGLDFCLRTCILTVCYSMVPYLPKVMTSNTCLWIFYYLKLRQWLSLYCVRHSQYPCPGLGKPKPWCDFQSSITLLSLICWFRKVWTISWLPSENPTLGSW